MRAFVQPARGAELWEAVHERRSIRVFREEPIPRQVVEELLRQALFAPSPHNSQPWRFTVLLDDEDKARLAAAMARKLEEELRADGLSEETIERQTFRSRRRITGAPVVVLCSLVRDGLVTYPDVRRNELEWQMAVQSVGAVMQTLFLLAWAQRIGTCWMAAPMYCPEVVRAALQLPPGYAPQALALLGYPAATGKLRERRAVSEVVELR
jgi:F420 biosynthesis protein FbiB-like protein